MTRRMEITGLVALAMLLSSAAGAAWLGGWAINNTTPASGFLLDGSAGKLITAPDYSGNLFAR